MDEILYQSKYSDALRDAPLGIIVTGSNWRLSLGFPERDVTSEDGLGT